MTKKELAQAIYKHSHLTGEFLLRSGITSNEYFDKYQFESRPEVLAEIAMQMVGLISDDFDALASMEMGGIPIATAISLTTFMRICFVRKQAKEYGTCKFAEGFDPRDKKLLIVEDVVTSGGQIIISADQLRGEGAIIDTAICVIDREQGGKENLAKAGINLISLFTMSEIKGFLN